MEKTVPILKYPGSKWSIAEWIVSLMPRHELYIEPFFGSGAVFFTKPPANCEILIDKNDEVVNLFEILRDEAKAEVLRQKLELTPYARKEWEKSKKPAKEPIERARRFLVRSWMTYGHTVASSTSGWRNDGLSTIGENKSRSSHSHYWNNLPTNLLVATKRLKQAQIECRDALEILPKYNDKNVLLYVDPPYLKSTLTSHVSLYTHEMPEEDEHKKLLQVLLDHKGPVMLSGYASELYDTMLKDWVRHESKCTSARGSKRTEVLWVNRLEHNPQLAMFL